MNEVIHGDALAVMRSLPTGAFRVAVTSPPYNLGAHHSNWQGGSDRSDPQYDSDDTGDALDEAEYVRWQRECLAEMLRLVEPDGAVYYNQGRRVRNGAWFDRREIVDGFPVRQQIIWHRPGGMNWSGKWFLPTTESIWLVAHDGYRVEHDTMCYTDVWRLPVERDRHGHPAPFPVALPLRAIRASGGPVLDPFGGIGTTGVAAVRAGAEYLLVERSALYCGVAEQRIAREAAQASLL